MIIIKSIGVSVFLLVCCGRLMAVATLEFIDAKFNIIALINYFLDKNIQIGLGILVGIFNAILIASLIRNRKGRKKVERELNALNVQYSDFLEWSKDAVSYWKAPDGLNINLPLEDQISMLYDIVCLDANKAFWSLYNIKNKDEIIGKKYDELSEGRTIDDAFKFFIANNYHVADRVTFEKLDSGEEIYNLETWYGVIENGFMVNLWAVSKTITEQKIAENKLKESEEKYRLLFECLPIGAYRTKYNGEILEVNSAMSGIFGFLPNSKLKNNEISFSTELYVNPEKRKMIIDELENKEITKYEGEFLKYNGEKFNGRLIMTQTVNKFGEVEYVGTLEDITERVRAVKQLQEKNEALAKNERILEGAEKMAHLGSYLYDIESDFFEYSKEVSRIYNISHQENSLNYRLRLDFIYPEDKGIIEGAIKKSKNQKESVRCEYRIIINNSQIKYLIDEFRTEFNEENEPLTIIGAVLDITPLKQIEIELIKHRNLLEELVKERTKELEESNRGLNNANNILNEKNKKIHQQNLELKNTLNALKSAQSQLVQSEKMASLGILTAGVAHEINNPLNYIKGGYSGIEKYFKTLENKNEEIEFLLHSIKTGVNRVTGIVKGLNQFSRDNEKYDEKCDIHSIINNCLLMMQNQLKHKVTINLNYINEPVYIIGNVGKLHQVFVNIISNAEQAISGSGEISIKTYKVENYVYIEISDTGAGISNNDMSKIAVPFYTTKKPGRGTGLGLSITYSIIHEHKGEIEFSSELNKGTKVRLTFPIKEFDDE